MLILAAVPDLLARRLVRATGRRFVVEAAPAWDQAVRTIQRRPVEIGVLDPALEADEPRAHEIERLRVLFPSLPIVLYTTLSPAVAPVLLRLGRAGVHQVILAGHGDHPTQLSDVLLAERARAVSARLITSLSDLFGELPGELSWAIETMIREPASVQSVQQLADRARMDRRTCLRWFARASLPTPKTVLTALRAVYAHRLLQDPGYMVEDVAAKLGYAQVRSFAQCIKEVFNMTPGEIRVRLTPDEALAVVRKRYFRREAQSLKQVS